MPDWNFLERGVRTDAMVAQLALTIVERTVCCRLEGDREIRRREICDGSVDPMATLPSLEGDGMMLV